MRRYQAAGGLRATRTVRCLLACTLMGMLLVGTGEAAAALPDNRGYELVSPALKNGGEVLLESQRVRAATDGSAVGFASLSGFSDVAGIGVSTDYMSTRTGLGDTSGWITHAITPQQGPMPFIADSRFMEPLYWGEFSDDLSHGVFRSFSPITDSANVATQQNWYVRDNLRTPGAGSYQLLTDCPGCSGPFSAPSPSAIHELSFLAGASEDFEHVIFESSLPLTADATADLSAGTVNLYEWDHGTVRLAGVLPDSECGTPPCPAPQSQAGAGAASGDYTPHTISSDGSRILFTVATANCSGLGHNDCGELYVRISHATTVQINTSEKTNGSGPGGIDDNGHQPAAYWDASTDGRQVFFSSGEALTNDSPVNGDRKLYVYSANPDAQGHHLTFVSADHESADDGSASDDVFGVIGASANGHVVYFVDGGGQLAAGASTVLVPGVSDRVFRWENGTVEYVGAIAAADEPANLNADFDLNPKQARVSPDGRAILFTASNGAGLTGYDHGACSGNGTTGGTCRELYLYSVDGSPRLTCVSCNPSGAPATADAADIALAPAGGAAVTYHINHPLANDGKRVFFSTGEALVSGDTNGKVDAYEYDVRGAALHLLSTGKDPSNSYFMDASSDGDDAFILTRERLVGWDVDGSYDLYDVRVDGGVPEPVGPVQCAADTCRGPVAAAPAKASVATPVTSGSNVHQVQTKAKKKSTVKCRRGYVRKRVHRKVRCVRKVKTHKAPRRRSRS